MLRSNQVVLHAQDRYRVGRDALACWWNRTVGCHHRTSVCNGKHKFGGRCIFGKNLISEGEDTIWKCLPKGFGIVPYLVAPMQRDISRKYELNVWTLVGEIPIDVSGFAIYPPIHRYYLRSIHDLFELCTTLRLHNYRFYQLKIAPLSHVFKEWLSFARTSSAPYSAGSEWCSCTIVHSPFTCLKPMVNRTVRSSFRPLERGLPQ